MSETPEICADSGVHNLINMAVIINKLCTRCFYLKNMSKKHFVLKNL